MNTVFTLLRDKHALWYKALLLLICSLLIVWFLPKKSFLKLEFENMKGKPWQQENLIAPFDFPIYKSKQEINKEVVEIRRASKIYFFSNTSGLEQKIRSFDTLNKTSSKKIYEIGKPILDSILSRGIIELHDSLIGKNASYLVSVVKDGLAVEIEIGSFFTLKTADDFILSELRKKEIQNCDELLGLFETFLCQTIYYDEGQTKKYLEQDLNNILTTRDKIVKGQIIISKGEIINDEKYEILNSLRLEQLSKNEGNGSDFLVFLGQFILVIIWLSVLFLFLAFFRKNIFSQNHDVTFLFLTVTIFVFISSKIAALETVSLYAVPFTIAPIVIRAFFDTRTALFVHLITILLSAFFVSDRFQFVFIETLTGIVAIFSIANLTRRSQLIISSLFIFAGYALTHLGLTLFLVSDLRAVQLNDFLVFGEASLLVLMAYPLIFLFEKGFGFISDFTLLELSDSNSPLLRELATKAPGTFQHTLQVATLAEEAVYKVGGNPLLIRTGAMYHDIGKLENPRFFTENQIGGSNPHEELTYEESASVIIKHVIRGIEIARDNKLPEQIIDFIRTHHGTGNTGYFYKMSLQENGPENTDISKFKYPGPIPFSKETAILMMADGVEAASRSLKKYDAVSIDELVENIINSKIEQNQFVNSDITFRDINNLKKIFKKRLMNIYHVRVEYPR